MATDTADSAGRNGLGWLRDLRWLGRRRAVGYGVILLLAEASLLIGFALQTHGMFGPAAPVSTDFLSFYSAGRLADRGEAASIYDLDRYFAEQRAVYGDPAPAPFYFFYPPIFVMVCGALALLPYLVAFYVWAGAQLTLVVVVVGRILRDRGLTIAFLSCPPLLFNFLLGQNAALGAGLIALATRIIDRRPALAGVLFGCVCYKPQLFFMVPVALLAGRRYRALVSAVLTVLALAGASLLILGAETWQNFLALSGLIQRIYAGGELGYYASVSAYAGVRMLGGSAAAGSVAEAVAIVLAVAAIVRVWRPDLGPALRGAVLTAGTLTAAPSAMAYDMLLAGIAIVSLVEDARAGGWQPWDKAVCGVIWIAMLGGTLIAEQTGIPVLPLIGPALLVLILRRAGLPAHATA
ncbi:MAG TPA: glycosyltransferase family 87 protein [Stellaceae bacterium]|nr:glycosyltransferase family 87 protein [Stellaceae bacterium]